MSPRLKVVFKNLELVSRMRLELVEIVARTTHPMTDCEPSDVKAGRNRLGDKLSQTPNQNP